MRAVIVYMSSHGIFSHDTAAEGRVLGAGRKEHPLRATVAHGFQEHWIPECPGSRHTMLVRIHAHLGKVRVYAQLKCSCQEMTGPTPVNSSQAATPAGPPNPQVNSGTKGSQSQFVHSIPVLLECPPQDDAAVIPIGAAGGRLRGAGGAARHINWRFNVQFSSV